MLVVFEGVDGVGKTTIMKEVYKQLVERGITPILTKEPGGPSALFSEWNELGMNYGFMYTGFRDMCLNHPYPASVKRALYRADALMNYELVIKPNIDKLILSDRSWVSDIAYGMVLAGKSLEALVNFNMALSPELMRLTTVVYLHADREVREARLASNTVDEMDKLGPAVRDQLVEAYETVFSTLRALECWKFTTHSTPEVVASQIVIKILSQ